MGHVEASPCIILVVTRELYACSCHASGTSADLRSSQLFPTDRYVAPLRNGTRLHWASSPITKPKDKRHSTVSCRSVRLKIIIYAGKLPNPKGVNTFKRCLVLWRRRRRWQYFFAAEQLANDAPMLKTAAHGYDLTFAISRLRQN